MPERVYRVEFEASGATPNERWNDWLGVSLPHIPSPTSQITEPVIGGLDVTVDANCRLALLAGQADAAAKKVANNIRKRKSRELKQHHKQQ